MQPGLFDNTKESIEQAYANVLPELGQVPNLQLELSCEHYFDDVVLYGHDEVESLFQLGPVEILEGRVRP